jgi:hypothetical protein
LVVNTTKRLFGFSICRLVAQHDVAVDDGVQTPPISVGDIRIFIKGFLMIVVAIGVWSEE